MADNEELSRAEQKAVNLHYLGWENGAGAEIWARVARDALVLHEEARQRFAGDSADREAWDRYHGSGLVLVVAIDQILLFEKRVRSLTDDSELAEGRARFDSCFPAAEKLRDLVIHMDEYAVGEGGRQTGRRSPPLEKGNLLSLVYWTDDGRTFVNLGDQQIEVGAAARAAIELAKVVERVRVRHFNLAKKAADDELRLRLGLPAEE